MASDSQATSSTSSSGTASPVTTPGFGDNRGIMFSIKTGGARYQCTIQDRSVYERMKASRQNSSDSTSSSASTASK